MTPLRDLLARCAAATGTDNPDLARDLCKAFIHRDDYPTIGTLLTWALTDPVRWQLGSAVALVEHLLPGRCIQIVKHRLSNEWRNDVCIWHPDETDETSGAFEATSASAPLAMVCALLKSLIAGEEKGRG